MRRQIKQTYIDFCQHTSIHGFNRTVDEENNVLKIFWILISITSLIAATYISALLWFRFVGNPISTTTKTIYAPIADIAFPGVTICPHPGIIPHKLDSFIDSLDLNGTDVTPQQIKESIDVVLALVSDLCYTYATNNSYEWLKRVFEKNGYDAFQVFQQLTMSCEEALLKCEFEQKRFACAEIFREVYTEAGRCCAFNSFLSGQQIRHTSNFGRFFGLKVLANSSLANYQNLSSAGITVLFHHYKEFPSALKMSRVISAGSVQYFQVKATVVTDEEDVKTHLSIDERNCVYASEFNISYNLAYAEQNCRHACIIRGFKQSCQCVPFNYQFTEIRTCTLDDINCIEDTEKKRSLERINCNCPYQCEDTKYRVLSTGSYLVHIDQSASEFLHGYNLSDISLGIVFFSRDTYTIMIRRVQSSTLQLMSTLGGTFGLFLGCSFTSAIEVLYCIFIRFLLNLKVLNKTADVPKRRIAFKASRKHDWGDLKLKTFYHSDGFYN